MKSAKFGGRVSGLAIALGTGAWLAAVPWSAAADPGSSVLDIPDPFGLDLADAVGLTGADPSGLDIDVSYNGTDLLHMGDATAHTGTGDWAIAYGDGATAEAGYGSTASGLSLVAHQDSAFADGAGSTAIAGGGDYDTAIASGGATADSGFVTVPGASATGGSNDIATASGAGSTADAAGQSFNTAAASDGGTADSGFSWVPGHFFGGGVGDSASANGTGSLADAGFGNNDVASVLGDHSTALAGGTDLPDNNDVAGVLGNNLAANATGANNLFVIEPTSLTGAAAAVPPVSDLGWDHAEPNTTSFFWAPEGQPTDVQTTGIAGLFGDTTEYQQFVEYESVDGGPAVVATGPDAGTMELAENIFTTPSGFGNEFGDVATATGSLASNTGDFTDLLTTPFGDLGPFGDIAHIFSEIVPLL